jgi:Lrp/AsnC family transcriptional regulator, regulator for asnA, asnC and gidA
MTKIDFTDQCIIALLQADGRLQHTDLARRLGIPEATVRRRMKRLLDERVMQIVAVPDPYRIGYDTHAIIGLRVQPGKIEDVVAVLDPLSQIRYIGVTAGTYDVVVEALFENNDELRHFLTDTLGQIDGLQGTDTSYVLAVAKRVYSVGVTAELEKECVTAEDRAILTRCQQALAEITKPAVSGDRANGRHNG